MTYDDIIRPKPPVRDLRFRRNVRFLTVVWILVVIAAFFPPILLLAVFVPRYMRRYVARISQPGQGARAAQLMDDFSIVRSPW